MPTSVYVTTPEAHCGKSLLCLGILETVLRRTQRVGIFRPIISGDARTSEPGRDKNIDLLLTHFKLDLPYEATYAYHKREAREMLANGRYDELLDTIIEKYKAVEQACDFVLCEGTDFTDEAAAFDVNINVDIAKNLGCPVLILGRGDLDRSLEDVLSPLRLAYDSFRERECPILGLVVNRAQPAMSHELLLALRNALPDKNLLLSVIPQNNVLQSPTVREIAEALDAEVLYGRDQLDRQARRYSVAAMQLQNYLPHLTENCLVITPGDRGDILLSVLQAHQSDNYPAIAGVLLTTQLNPDEPIRQLLEGLPNLVPILSVSANTYNTAFQLSQINSYVTADNDAKIQLSKQLFDKYVDTAVLTEKISTVRQRGITPRMFQYTLV
ncbi:MAG: DRTGG domain-containing protein, partial [Tunicatimonas sp.]